MFFSGGGGYLLLICQCVLQEELEVIEEEGEEGEEGEDEYLCGERDGWESGEECKICS